MVSEVERVVTDLTKWNDRQKTSTWTWQPLLPGFLPANYKFKIVPDREGEYITLSSTLTMSAYEEVEAVTDETDFIANIARLMVAAHHHPNEPIGPAKRNEERYFARIVQDTAALVPFPLTWVNQVLSGAYGPEVTYSLLHNQSQNVPRNLIVEALQRPSDYMKILDTEKRVGVTEAFEDPDVTVETQSAIIEWVRERSRYLYDTDRELWDMAVVINPMVIHTMDVIDYNFSLNGPISGVSDELYPKVIERFDTVTPEGSLTKALEVFLADPRCTDETALKYVTFTGGMVRKVIANSPHFSQNVRVLATI